MSKVFFQIENIAPAKAAQYLQKNNSNRPLNEKRAAALAIAMSNGDWELNGDSIRFDENGVLLDGQHRLTAIVASGVTIKSMVVYGLPSKVFDTIDAGARRSACDILSISGEKNSNVLASVARTAFIWERTGTPHAISSVLAPTARDIERYIESNPNIRDCTNDAVGYKWIKSFLTASIGGFCIYAAKKSSLSDFADSFFETLDTGNRTQIDCPVFMLREAIISDKLSRDKMPKPYKIALVFKCFKKYASGESLKTLRIRTSGPHVEKDIYALPGCNYPLR